MINKFSVQVKTKKYDSVLNLFLLNKIEMTAERKKNPKQKKRDTTEVEKKILSKKNNNKNSQQKKQKKNFNFQLMRIGMWIGLHIIVGHVIHRRIGFTRLRWLLLTMRR